MNNNIKENYRISLPNQTIRVLNRDKKYFGLKSNNYLYNRIIENYSETFPFDNSNVTQLKKILIEEIQDIDVDSMNKVLQRISHLTIKGHLETKNVESRRISIKRTNISNKGFDFLLPLTRFENLSTIQKVIKQLLISYSKLSNVEREKILFKEEFDTIQRAIENRYSIRGIYNNKNIVINPIMTFEPKEDIYNYLIADHPSKGLRILRVSKLTNIYIDKYSSFDIPSKKLHQINQIKERGITMVPASIVDSIKPLFNKLENYGSIANVIKYIMTTSGDELTAKFIDSE